jgi:hypothetical protein
VVLFVNPVPVRVTELAMLMAPALGDRLVNVGTGGLLMVSVTAFEPEGIAFGVLTVTVAVPAVVRSDAGTVAISPVLPENVKGVVVRSAPFHCTTEVEVRPVPLTVRDVAGEPTTMLVGEIVVMTGVAGR